MQDSNNTELLKLYWDEWKFRQEGFWKRIINFFVIIFFVSTLPITINIFPVSLPNISALIFPIFGIMLTIVFLWFCLSEAIIIDSIDEKVKQIIKDTFSEKYVKTTLVPLTKHTKKPPSIFTCRMSKWVPILLSAMQLIVALFMIYLIVADKLL